MKYFCLILLTCLSFLSTISAQDLKPTNKLALLEFKVTDKKSEVVVKPTITIRSTNKGKTVKKQADENGLLSQLLPVGDVYYFSIEGGDIEIKFALPAAPNQTYTIPLVYAPLKFIEEGSLVEDAVDNKANLMLYLKDDDRNPLQEFVTLTNQATGKEYKGETDAKGFKTFIVENASKYFVSFEGAPEYTLIEVEDLPNLTLQKEVYFTRHDDWNLYPSYNKGLLNFNYKDLDGISNEEVFSIKTKKSKKVLSCKTNAAGFGQIQVPLDDKYSIKTPFNDDFGQIEAPSSYFIHTINHKGLSTAARKLRDAELEKVQQERDSIVKAWEAAELAACKARAAFRKEMLLASDKDASNSLKDTFLIMTEDKPYRYVNMRAESKDVAKELLHTATQYRALLEKDPAIFVKHKKNVLAILNRLQGSWGNKIIISDITGSMSPYYHQVLIWHALNVIKGGTTKYVFFNDGDAHPDGPIGASGGLHITEGKLDDLQVIIEKLQEGLNAGSGGLGPENDIEALLGGIAERKKGEEIILIADGLCKVRDLRLLNQIKVPVRVILCGGPYSNRLGMNPQYLRIARKTKGSVHTIEEDIMNLSTVTNGETITIYGKQYELQDGEFIPRRSPMTSNK